MITAIQITYALNQTNLNKYKSTITVTPITSVRVKGLIKLKVVISII